MVSTLRTERARQGRRWSAGNLALGKLIFFLPGNTFCYFLSLTEKDYTRSHTQCRLHLLKSQSGTGELSQIYYKLVHSTF